MYTFISEHYDIIYYISSVIDIIATYVFWIRNGILKNKKITGNDIVGIISFTVIGLFPIVNASIAIAVIMCNIVNIWISLLIWFGDKEFANWKE